MPLRPHTPTPKRSVDRHLGRTGKAAPGRNGRPRRSLLLVASLAVPLVVVGGAGAVLAATGTAPTNAAPPPADPNPNCSLMIPADPLTAKGLATPYQLVATDRRQGACHEANSAQAAFVEAAVVNPATGAISVYHPLVVDRGTRPAVTAGHARAAGRGGR